MSITQLSLARVRQALSYDPATGIFVWRERPAKNSRRRAGDEAGTIKELASGRYRYITVDGIECTGAQLAWFMGSGTLPETLITAKNGDMTDLRFENLAAMPTTKEKFDHRSLEGRAAYLRAHRAENPDVYRNHALKRNFGIDLADYQRMFVEQGGVCAVCSRPETEKRQGKTKWLAVDHNHETGEVRGLLCTRCNKAIGEMRDDPNLLRNAATYLEQHAADAAKTNVVPLRQQAG